MRILLGLILISFILSSCNDQKKKVDLESLLREMSHPAALTYYPEPTYTLKQFSSYDRRSLSQDSGWFANQDYTQFLDVDTLNGRREYIMFDHEGPGAIVRWWMTFAGEGSTKGIIRVYLDGSDTPVIEDSVLSILSGTNLTSYPLSASVSEESDYLRRGHNLYLPIPYGRSCRITYECGAVEIGKNTRKPNIYYNVNYRAYSEDTEVKSLSIDDLTSLKTLILEVGSKLLRGRERISETTSYDINLSPGESTEMIFAGPAAINYLQMDYQGLTEEALRGVELRVEFDEIKTISSPVGDFFNAGYHVVPFQTFYTGADDSALWSSHVMPFRQNMKLAFINHSNSPVIFKAKIGIAEYSWKSNSMYFTATTHEYRNIIPAGILNPGNRSPVDLNFINMQGRGVYISDAIVLFNTDDAWWGEGDEKIYVDGESFPSSFGTGTEDYYGYAWARPEKFSHPFIAQPDGSGNFYPGYTVNIRHRGLDGIPFNESIKVDMELLHWVSTPMNYAVTVKGYIHGNDYKIIPDPRSDSGYPFTSVMDRFELVSLIPDNNGLWEGERLEILNASDVNTTTQYIPSFNWSNKGQLWWTNGQPGDILELGFENTVTGKSDMIIGLTKAEDYGVYDIIINGKKVAEFDGYVPDTVYSIPYPIRAASLLKGKNKLELRLKEPNPKAKEGNMVGVDYLRIDK